MEETREKGRRWVISTREEMRLAVIDVAREATRKVSIFTHDLEPGIYDDPEFLEVIKRLVLSQTYARIRVLIADPAHGDLHGASLRERAATSAKSRSLALPLSIRACAWSAARLTVSGQSGVR